MMSAVHFNFKHHSRAICGIRDRTLIINLPGSKKAVVECFGAIQSVLKHAIELIRDEKAEVVQVHDVLKKDFAESAALYKKLTPTPLESETSYEEIAELLDKSSSSMDEVGIFVGLMEKL